MTSQYSHVSPHFLSVLSVHFRTRMRAERVLGIELAQPCAVVLIEQWDSVLLYAACNLSKGSPSRFVWGRKHRLSR